MVGNGIAHIELCLKEHLSQTETRHACHVVRAGTADGMYIDVSFQLQKDHCKRNEVHEGYQCVSQGGSFNKHTMK